VALKDLRIGETRRRRNIEAHLPPSLLLLQTSTPACFQHFLSQALSDGRSEISPLLTLSEDQKG